MKPVYCLISFLILAFTTRAQNNYNEITLPELIKKKHNGDKNIVIVDVRSKGEYYDSITWGRQSNIGKIKDAVSVTLQDLRQNPDAATKQLDAYKDKEIYLICSHSYRSRAASNILLKNGFTQVNNVQGGMTEWYRRYDELSPYMNEFLEKGTIYQNMAPSQLLNALQTGRNPLVIAIQNNPKFWWDSANVRFFQYFPMVKNTITFNYADSLKLWREVQKAKGRPIIFLNTVNNGAAELAYWLAKKGIPEVSYLVGGENLFYEYVSNKQMPRKTDNLFRKQSNIRFITPGIYCAMTSNNNIQMIDLRHDSLFNKVNSGVKHDYKHLKSAVNFFAGKGAIQFEQEFPGKKKEYVFISDNYDGLEMADALTKKGYKICWMIGGLDRWEWYMNNVEDFGCNDLLVQ
jgi:rhodanese-related sulfurtransferase